MKTFNTDYAFEFYFDYENAATTLDSRFCSITVSQEYTSVTKSLQCCASYAFSGSLDDSNCTI